MWQHSRIMLTWKCLSDDKYIKTCYRMASIIVKTFVPPRTTAAVITALVGDVSLYEYLIPCTRKFPAQKQCHPQKEQRSSLLWRMAFAPIYSIAKSFNSTACKPVVRYCPITGTIKTAVQM